MNKEEQVVEFFKEAWCVDGDVKLIKEKDQIDFKIKAIIELNDSKRGRFYVAQLDVISEKSD